MLPFSTQAQNKKFFVITGKIVPEEASSGTGVIEITKNGIASTPIEIPKNGRFRFELEFFNEYNLNFVYPGHFSKIITVSTQIPQEVWERDSDFPPFPMIVQLSKEFEGIDKSFTLKPTGKIFYAGDIDNFAKESYVPDLNLVEQIENAKSQAGQVKKDINTVSKETAQELAARQKDFDQLIKEADALYQRGEFQMALLKYLDAKKIFPDKAYPNDRVAELQDLVKALENTKKQQAELEQKYLAAIEKANGFFNQKTYLEARPVYEEALSYKPGDVFANGRIKEIDDLLALLAKQKEYKDLLAKADASYQSKNYDQAVALYSQAYQIVPEEKYPQDQISKINIEKAEQEKAAQLETEFNQTIQAANNLVQQKDNLQALNTFKKALGLKPDSKLAKDKIAEIEQAIVTIENDKKYSETIQLADQALGSGDFQRAKMQFQEALKLKSAEAYPKLKLDEIAQAEAKEIQFNDLMTKAEQAFSINNLDESVKLYSEALALKPKDKAIQQKIDDIQSKQKQLATDKEYTDLISQADQAFQNNQLDVSLSAYNKALQVKKTESYPKDQVKRIESYQTIVKNADKKLDSKDYTNALAQYGEALKVKPDDNYSSGKIAEITRIQEAEKQQAAAALAKLNEYNVAIKAADQLFGTANYAESLLKYKEASGIKPDETYPNKRIKEIETIQDGIAKELARIEKEYQTIIAQANKILENKDYTNAKASYQKALEIRPDDSFALSQIKNIDATLDENRRLELEKQRKQEEAIEIEFNLAMTNADKAFTANDFETARTGYSAAMAIKPGDAVAKQKFGETEARLAQIARMSQAYSKAIDEANKELTAKKYQEAKEKYQEALQYKADAEYPKTQISKIDELLARQLAEAKLLKDYNDAVTLAETQFKNKELKKAKETFMIAYNLIPSEPVPPRRIKEIDLLLAEQMSKEMAEKATMEAYLNAISRADKSFGNKEYKAAKLVYNEALLIKPDEKYPEDQLALIEKLIQEQIEQQYKSSIAKADVAFTSENYAESINRYKEALTYKKDDAYSIRQIKESEIKFAEQEAEKNRLKKLEEDYKALLVNANADFSAKNYAGAKGKYQQALALKPNEVYPKDQLAKIEQILGSQAKEAEINSQYNQLLANAQELFKSEKLQEARDTYQKAYNLKPFESIPPMRIAEIDKMLVDLDETAKLAAMEKAQREAKEKADRLQYTNAIAAADKAFAAKEYIIARAHYITALNALANEQYPKDQIAKIDDLLTQAEMDKMIAQQKAQQDSVQKVKNKQFELAMAAAKDHDQNKQYDLAIAKYREAIQIKPDQRAAVDPLIREIEDKLQTMARQDQEYKRIIQLADSYFNESKLTDALTEYRNAISIKSDEIYPKNQIKEIQARLTKLEEDYSRAITRADKSFDASDWNNAKTAYTEAIEIKPNEKYPFDRLRETNQKIADASLLAISNSAENKAYLEAIEKANQLLKEDKLTAARMQFQVAQTLKAEEKLPAERIKEIDALIEQRNKERLLNAQKEIDEKYRQAISVADNSFREKSYEIAKLQYKQALIIKPAESYPQNQMDLIDQILNKAKPVETYTYQLPEIDNSVPETKPAVKRIVETAEATESRANSYVGTTDYDDAIKKADNSFGIKDYTVARFYYYKANEFKPTEEYPQKQIEIIRKLIDSELSSADNSGYEQAIKLADEAFVRQNYNVAKFYYYKALDIKSWEKYPKDRINEILALTNSLLSEQEEKEYRDMIAKADEAFFNKDVSIARFYYNKAISMKKEEEYPRIKLKDIQKLIEQDARDEENQQYLRLITEADQALANKNYSIARFNYNKALSMKPDEKYPKDQLKVIKDALNNPNN
ncbi:MAG: hypothetical protein WAO52_02745 [Prolixibacteraceae bacterium]